MEERFIYLELNEMRWDYYGQFCFKWYVPDFLGTLYKKLYYPRHKKKKKNEETWTLSSTLNRKKKKNTIDLLGYDGFTLPLVFWT